MPSFRNPSPRRWSALLAGLLVVAYAASNARAQNSAVTLTPALVEAGSPVLIHVEAPATATLYGDWLGRKLEFFPARDGRGWFALAGVDVEGAVGAFCTSHYRDAEERNRAGPEPQC